MGLHGDQLRQAKAFDEHCRRCADEINRRNFDILFANSSIIQAVSSIGRYVKSKKVLYLQEPNRWFTKQEEADCHGLQFRRRSILDAPRYIRWFVCNLIGTQRLRVLARERAQCHAFDLILVNSYFSRETLLRVYGLDSTVCYLGVDTQLFVNHRYAERTLSSAWAN